MSGPEQAQQQQERQIAEDAIVRALRRFERETGLKAISVDLNRNVQTISGDRSLMSTWITAELPR